MNTSHRSTYKRTRVVAALIAGAAGLAHVSSAHADSRAAQKMGQIGVINQTLQPKPVRSAPGSANPGAPAGGQYQGGMTTAPNTGAAANGTNPANPSSVRGGAYAVPAGK